MGIKRFVWVLPPGGTGDRWEAGMALQTPQDAAAPGQEAQGSCVQPLVQDTGGVQEPSGL